MSGAPYVTVGKAPANDIEVADTHVSRNHAVLFESDDGWYLYDLDSTNGTFVNGKRVAAALISSEDVVTLGHSYRLDIGQVASAFQRQPTRHLEVFLRIGNAVDNDMTTDDPLVSRHHALVCRRGDAVEIFDADSTNGLFIEGQRVRSSPVYAESTIGLGPNFNVSGGALMARTEPPPAEAVRREQPDKTGKTTWVRRQLDLMRSEQIRELREMERRQAHEASLTRIRLVRGGIAAVVVVVSLVVSLFVSSRKDSLTAALESRRDAVVMIRCVDGDPGRISTDGAKASSSLLAQRPPLKVEDLALFSDDGQGSGFVYHHFGRPVVITNRHVVDPWLGAQAGGPPVRLVILTQGNTRAFEAEVLKVHAEKDVAILGFVGMQPAVPEVELQADWEMVERGDRVGFMSFPLASGSQRRGGLSADIGKGLISNKYDDEVKHDIATAPGSSGGPIFDSEGRVIAINLGQSTDQQGTLYQGLNWGVPVRYAMELLEEL